MNETSPVLSNHRAHRVHRDQILQGSSVISVTSVVDHPSRRLSVTVALVVACFLSATLVTAEIVEQILVKVNGEIFTKTDLEARQVAALRQKNVQGDPSDDLLKKELGQVTPQIMVDAVAEMLLIQRAKELGYRLSDEQFKQAVDNIKKEYKLDNDEKFQAALKQENMTMNDLRRQFERQILVQRVEQVEIFGKIAISEDEARKYHQEHLEEFTTPASVTLREVLVALPNDGKGPTAAQEAAVKAKAEKIHALAVAGDNFMKLAEDSSDAPSRANAGLIGPLNMSDLSADVRKVIEPMKSGEITPLIRTSRGFQFFKVETVTAAETVPFEQAREQINERVIGGKRKDEFDKYLTKLKAQAIIEWKNEDVKKAYEEGLAAQGAQGAQAKPATTQ
jgi:parvulin-like peptidyl-prolyl isomerase